MKDSLRKAGYDAEELYFLRLNQKLIEKLRTKTKAIWSWSKPEPVRVDNVVSIDTARAQRKKAA